MQDLVEKLKIKAYQNSTWENYYTIWCLFNKFFLHLDNKPDSWEDRLVLFVANLVDEEKESATIRLYCSVIKAVLRMEGIDIQDNIYELRLLTRACKLHNDTFTNVLPIRKGLLRVMLDNLEVILDKQNYLLNLYKVIFSIAYYGLLRISEIAYHKHAIRTGDILLSSSSRYEGNRMHFMLRSSETHGKRNRPQMITIRSVTENSYQGVRTLMDAEKYCPYQLLQNYCNAGGFYSTTEYLFIFRDGTLVKAWNVCKVMKDTLTKLGLDASLYRTHSFHIGQATDMLKMGISFEWIKRIGRWKSNSVYRYLHEA